MRNLTAIILMVIASAASAATAVAVSGAGAEKEPKKTLVFPDRLTVEQAAYQEDACLAERYFSMLENGFRPEEAEVKALDVCVQEGQGRLAYVAQVAEDFEDPAPTEASKRAVKERVLEHAQVALNRIAANCSATVSVKECLKNIGYK